MQLFPRSAVLLLCCAPGAALAQTTAEYLIKEEARGSRVHLAAFPIRPMVLVPGRRCRW